VARKVGNFIGKAGHMVGSLIGKATFIVRNIGKFMNYRLDQLGIIGKTLNGVTCGIDSVIGMLSAELKEKSEWEIDRDAASKNLGCHVDQRSRNMGGEGKNQSLGGQVKQAPTQLLHDFTSNRNIEIFFYFFNHN
jgi:hypothetical protein